MKKNLAIAIAAGALAASSVIIAPPAAAGPMCRTISFAGCSTTEEDDSPENPRSIRGHKSGKTSHDDGKEPAIRFRPAS